MAGLGHSARGVVLRLCVVSTVLLGGLVVTATPAPAIAACGDGVDNDGDQKVDYPSDPGCASAADQSEGPTCPPLAPGVMVCLAPGSLFERYELIFATASLSGPSHHIAGWVDQYRFNVAGVITTLSCVRLAVDASMVNPCAEAGGTFVTRVATLLDREESEPALATPTLTSVDVCHAELTVTVAGNGVNSAPAYALCQPLLTVGVGGVPVPCPPTHECEAYRPGELSPNDFTQ